MQQQQQQQKVQQESETTSCMCLTEEQGLSTRGEVDDACGPGGIHHI